MAENDKEKDEEAVSFEEIVERIKSRNYSQKDLKIYARLLETFPKQHLPRGENEGDTVWCLKHDIPVSRGYCKLERFNCEFFGNRCMGCQ